MSQSLNEFFISIELTRIVDNLSAAGERISGVPLRAVAGGDVVDDLALCPPPAGSRAGVLALPCHARKVVRAV